MRERLRTHRHRDAGIREQATSAVEAVRTIARPDAGDAAIRRGPRDESRVAMMRLRPSTKLDIVPQPAHHTASAANDPNIAAGDGRTPIAGRIRGPARTSRAISLVSVACGESTVETPRRPFDAPHRIAFDTR
ncbi:hypothetical protein [Burkholderia oklahomensis]|uniref:hypothetical protein n=1 Tax=Burkholderia oklahomensis TaxID=342113 RepID=UPI000A526A30|nr:hypothetical protein [Burkholderia oklahomensis]